MANGLRMAFTAVLFPGQGSLTPASAERSRDLWPELVERACELVGEDPFARARESTLFAQPAIFVASLAAWRERSPGLVGVRAMAGHSLGELSALAAAGALEVDDALRLVVLRAKLMAEAAATRAGGMVALLGASATKVRELADRHGVVVANDNAPGQIVVSGRRAPLARLAAAARREGIRLMELDVAGPFHSPDMRPALLPFLRAVERTPAVEPSVPVFSGLTARPFRDLPLELSAALVAGVRWREVMAALVEMGATEFVDVGPGRVLERLVQRNVPEGAHSAA